MAVAVEREPEQAPSPTDQPAKLAFPTPYLGRTVRIVDKVGNVDTNQLPHPMNARGELGVALFHAAECLWGPEGMFRRWESE